MSTDRRHFLQRLTVGTVAASLLPSTALHAETPHVEPRITAGPLGEFDLEAAAADEWDTSWTKKLTGKHKAVFDAPELDGGVGVIRSGLWMRQYTDVFKLQPADLNSVIVLRHAAIPLVMTQAFWDEYEVGKKNKVTDPLTDKKTGNNPALLIGAPASYATMALDKQMANGAVVLACNMAFARIVGMVSQKTKLKGAEARAEALKGVIPGIILQPSGFFATTLAGEHGCVYVRAS